MAKPRFNRSHDDLVTVTKAAMTTITRMETRERKLRAALEASQKEFLRRGYVPNAPIQRLIRAALDS